MPELTDYERDTLQGLGSEDGCGVVPLQFTKVNKYVTFNAEYAFDGPDIVFHFYLPESQKYDVNYWLSVFPSALDPVARTTFNATAPRLRAAYTEELRSWWLRANRYDHIPDRTGLVMRFLERLDQTLTTVISA
jgi:hypothetical protein